MNYYQIISLIGRILSFDYLYSSDKSKFIKEFYNNLNHRKINLNQILTVSSNQLVLISVYNKIKKLKLLKFLEYDFIVYLNNLSELNKERNLKILEQIKELNSKFEQANIRPVYFKGAGNLLNGLYTEKGERLIGDIDVLIQEKDYLNAAQCIQEIGYFSNEKIFSDINTLKHFPILSKIEYDVGVEIHRLPVIKKYSNLLTSHQIFSNKINIENYKNCYVPSDKHSIIINFIHCQLSNQGHSFRTVALRDLYDFFLLSKKISFDQVIQVSEKKTELKIYYSLMRRIFNIGSYDFESNNKSIKRYFFFLDWLYQNPRKHHFFILLLKMKEIFVTRTILFLSEYFKNKSFRKGIIERLTYNKTYKLIPVRIRKLYFNYVKFNPPRKEF